MRPTGAVRFEGDTGSARRSSNRRTHEFREPPPCQERREPTAPSAAVIGHRPPMRGGGPRFTRPRSTTSGFPPSRPSAASGRKRPRVLRTGASPLPCTRSRSARSPSIGRTPTSVARARSSAAVAFGSRSGQFVHTDESSAVPPRRREERTREGAHSHALTVTTGWDGCTTSYSNTICQ